MYYLIDTHRIIEDWELDEEDEIISKHHKHENAVQAAENFLRVSFEKFCKETLLTDEEEYVDYVAQARQELEEAGLM